MKLLVLGGTVFAGRAIVESALARGHEVTLFNRGKNHAELFPEAEKLRGDRDGGLDALKGRRWDAVIDPSGYIPRLVGHSANLLADATDHYTFISTISVYADQSTPGNHEYSALATMPDPTVEKVDGQTYGPLKVLCEQAAETALPGRVLTIRPGLIVGPHDPTDRFTYWPVRFARGGEVLVPDAFDMPNQLIDARDLGQWTIRMVEARHTGIYNAVGPDYPLTFGEMIRACDEGSPGAEITLVSEEFLLEQQVRPFMGLPFWLPASGPRGLMECNGQKAFAAGLTFRPLAETTRDTLAWDSSRPQPIERRAGITPEQESKVLAAWHARNQA